jgi:hypothetical protein
MKKIYEEVEGRIKQIFGEIIGDGRLFSEGEEQVRNARMRRGKWNVVVGKPRGYNMQYRERPRHH